MAERKADKLYARYGLDMSDSDESTQSEQSEERPMSRSPRPRTPSFGSASSFDSLPSVSHTEIECELSDDVPIDIPADPSPSTVTTDFPFEAENQSINRADATTVIPVPSCSSSACSSPNSVEEWEGGFVTEAILQHMTYPQVYGAYMNNLLLRPFLPSCRMSEEHSKYVYLVRWKGFGEEEDTWEPEENLEENGTLLEYKRKNGLPEERQLIRKLFSWNIDEFLASEQEEIYGRGGDNSEKSSKRGDVRRKKQSIGKNREGSNSPKLKKKRKENF